MTLFGRFLIQFLDSVDLSKFLMKYFHHFDTFWSIACNRPKVYIHQNLQKGLFHVIIINQRNQSRERRTNQLFTVWNLKSVSSASKTIPKLKVVDCLPKLLKNLFCITVVNVIVPDQLS